MFSSSAPASIPASITAPSPLKKKMSLSDYTRRNKKTPTVEKSESLENQLPEGSLPPLSVEGKTLTAQPEEKYTKVSASEISTAVNDSHPVKEEESIGLGHEIGDYGVVSST